MKSDAFREAAEAKDFGRLDDLVADEVVFRSPVVFKPYEGRESLGLILGAVSQVFEDFLYVDQVETGDTAVLRFEARVGDRSVEGVDILGFDADGKIRDFTVMVRPMSGMNALAEAMSAMLEAAQGGASNGDAGENA